MLRFIRQGISQMWRYRGLVLLLYGIGLTIAALIATSLIRILDTEIGSTGFSGDLVENFDIVLWADFWRGIIPGLSGVARQTSIAALLMLTWKTVSNVGLVHAFGSENSTGFWDGVHRFGIRSLGLALLFLVPLVALILIILVVAFFATHDMGEVGVFWTWAVVVPLTVVWFTAFFDLLHDYARLHLVLRDGKITASWRAGVIWPFRHFRAIFLYKAWFFVTAILWISVFVIGFLLPDHSVAAVFGAFLIQQGLILARTGASVSWIASEVAIYQEFADPAVSDEGSLATDSTDLEGADTTGRSI